MAAKMKLADVCNAKTARTVLDDYDGDIDKMKKTEPWLFAKHMGGDGSQGSKTRLLNASAATDEGKPMSHWHDIAGLIDNKQDE